MPALYSLALLLLETFLEITINEVWKDARDLDG